MAGEYLTALMEWELPSTWDENGVSAARELPITVRGTIKRSLHIVLVILLSLTMVGVAFAATNGKMDLKVGEEVYVCICGPSCPCQTMSMKKATAPVATSWVKAKVTKVEKDDPIISKIFLK